MREQKLYLVSRETLHERSFFTNSRIRELLHVVHEGVKLKGFILFTAIYQIGDAAYSLVLENIVLVL